MSRLRNLYFKRCLIYPPKFSVEDKYGKYRRILKKEAMKEK